MLCTHIAHIYTCVYVHIRVDVCVYIEGRASLSLVGDQQCFIFNYSICFMKKTLKANLRVIINNVILLVDSHNDY